MEPGVGEVIEDGGGETDRREGTGFGERREKRHSQREGEEWGDR